MKNRKFTKIVPLFLSITFLFIFVALIYPKILKHKEEHSKSRILNYVSDISKDQEAKNATKQSDIEMRAVWVPFMELDVRPDFSEEKFKNKFKKIVNVSKNYGINTLIVHVRPYGDSLYPSKIFPWSHIFTGVQGLCPGFDPLKFMIQEAHKEGLFFNAWINPMRIKRAGTPEELCNSNPYIKIKKDHQDDLNKYIIDYNGDIIYDPESPEIRNLIIDGVKEIVENYDVDAVSFDDYFYPTDNLWIDRKSYDEQQKGLSSENISEQATKQRMNSINLLISGVYKSIKDIKPTVQFGISPQGNLNNARKAGADIDKWMSSEGYLDYICPEIYTNSSNPILPFDKAVDEWKTLAKLNSLKLYVGLGLYKAGSDLDNLSWKESNNIIANQIEYARKSGYHGFMIYSWPYLENSATASEVSNAMKVLK